MTRKLCFTGPRQLEGSYDVTPTHTWARERLAAAIARAYNKGFTKFYSGGALGVDQIAAEEVINFRASNVDVRLIMAIPCEGQERRWPNPSQNRYHRILEQADETILVTGGKCEGWKMLVRNEWMVDNTEAVVAVWDERLAGGTGKTVKYAQGEGRPVFQINPITTEEGWLTTNSSQSTA